MALALNQHKPKIAFIISAILRISRLKLLVFGVILFFRSYLMRKQLWHDHYPSHVAPEVDVTQYQSLVDVFEQSSKTHHSRTAYISMGTTLSFREVDQLSAQFAAYLQHVLKLKKGSRIALMMPNILQYPIAVFGALRAGLVIVNVNPLYTPRELAHQLADAQAETIVLLENFAQTLQLVLDRTPIKNIIITRIGDLFPFPKQQIIHFALKHVKKLIPKWRLPHVTMWQDAMKQGQKFQLDAIQLTRDDLAFLQYTGGTTGRAKGAMLTHGNLMANMIQAKEWIMRDLFEGKEFIVTALPLYHIFSLTANLLVFHSIGASNVLILNPRDIPALIKELKKYPITVITGVNTLFNALLHHPDFASCDFSTWKISLGGGMAVQKAVADAWKKTTGRPLIEAYGLTEASPAVCMNPMNLESFNGSVGLPLPSTEVEIRQANGDLMPLGERGELWVKGPQVMKGYWNNPGETAKVLDDRGFLDTGDIAVMNECGYVCLVDRKKDMILVSGFNVYPNEIEDLLVSHPKVLEVACIGVPNAKSGEAVKIFVVAKDQSLTEDEILSFCREHLTGYKIPRLVEFRDELPKTNVGKIMRRELRQASVAQASIMQK